MAKSGWARLKGEPRSHHFTGGRSACKKWMLFGIPSLSAIPPSGKFCAVCQHEVELADLKAQARLAENK